MSYTFGDIVLVPFPFTIQMGSKKRPAVVVSSAAYQANRPDIVLMPVSSKISSPLRFAEILIQHWQSANLPKPSFIKPSLASFEQSLIIKRLGTLTVADTTALKALLARLLDE